MQSKITIVAVLYNMKINNSNTLNSIKEISGIYNLSNFSLIIYDNSPDSQQISNLFSLQTLYYHDKNNGGINGAYNFALDYCIKKQIYWLLLLDQDTELTKEYFSEIEATIPTNNEAVCIVPQILSNNKKVSPKVIKKGGFTQEIKGEICGIYDFQVVGINSGTLLKVDFIKSLGGFNPLFKMDMLDYWYFRMIYKNNKKVYIMKNLIKHDLSVMDYANISVDRYKNIINAEMNFFRNYCPKSDLYVFNLRLVLRLIRQLIRVKNKRIAGITLKYLFFKNANRNSNYRVK